MHRKKMIDTFAPQVKLMRRFLPAFAFFCGFIWDSVTMGRVVSFFDLLVLSAYYFGAGLVLILLVREIKPQWQNWLIFLMQFFFGGLFSALVVFYFKSSGSIYTFSVVLCLVFLLIANEFLAEQYLSRTLCWTLFAVCGTMYLNFLIPHIVHSIKAIWFYLSCLLSLGLVYAIRRLAVGSIRKHVKIGRARIRYRNDLRQLIPATSMVLLLVAFYQLHLIPPVPLVLKESYICKNVKQEGGAYQCQVEKQNFWVAMGIGENVVHFKQGDKIYSLNAVFAPKRITVDLEQRWWRQDDDSDAWLTRGVVPLPMVGGRQGGWRSYTYINAAVQTGRWKVETAVKDGAVLAVDYFTAKPQEDSTPQTYIVQVE